MAVEGDGVVVVDPAAILEAEDGLGVEPIGPGEVGWLGLGGLLAEAAVVAGQELPQDPVGLLQGAGPGPGPAQRLEQPVLQGSEEAFDAPLGLRGVSRDELDAQLIGQAPELASSAFPGQFLLQGGLFGALEDGVAIGIEGQGEAVALHDLPQQQEVSGGILLGPEEGEGYLSGGVVDGCDQDQSRSAAFEPIVIAAVQLEEHPRPGPALRS